jgi:hypothetical protein
MPLTLVKTITFCWAKALMQYHLYVPQAKAMWQQKDINKSKDYNRTNHLAKDKSTILRSDKTL